MTPAQKPIISVLVVIGLAIGGCSPPPSESRQSAAQNRTSFNMRTELDADGLRDFLAGKEMISATHASSNPSYQRFFAGGAWESMDFEIEIVRRKGRWAVKNDNQSRLKLCVTVTEQNGRKISGVPDNCYGIIINKENMDGSILPSDDGAIEVFVKFRDLVV